MTPQYLDLNALLATTYKNASFQIAAFPCDQFELQEPGKDSEILNGIKYVRPGGGFTPLPRLKVYGKLQVNGAQADPLYQFLRATCPNPSPEVGIVGTMFWNPITASDITWNFEKFLVDCSGRPRYRFFPSYWNNGATVQPYVNQLLAECKPSAPAAKF